MKTIKKEIKEKECHHADTSTDAYGRIWCNDCKRFLYQ